MKLRILLASAISALFFSAQATVHNVAVGSNFFNPSTLTITAGDTVLWTNTGGFHNVDGSDASNPITFGNGPASSSSWTYQFQFTQAGTYNYVCTPHAPGMAGTVTVNPAATTVTGLVSQGFETTTETWPFAINPVSYNTSGDVWDTVTGFGTNIPAASQGTNFWGMQDLDNPNGGGAFGHTMTFTTVDVSALTNVNLKFDYYTVGYDPSDSLAYQLEYNNGTTWGAKTELNKDSQAWVTENIQVPAGTQFVRLRFYAVQNGGSDYAGIDNVRIDTGSAVVSNPGIPTYAIADVTTEDAVTGDADSVGVECKLVGLVSTPNFRASGSGVEFTLTDMMNTAGITVRNTSLNTYTPTMGDEVRVIGTIGQFRGLTQLNVDSIVVLSTGNALPVPAVQTNLGEFSEGKIIRLNGVQLVNGNNWGAGNNDIYFPNGGDTVTLRFDTDFGTTWGTAPTGTFDVIGVGGQFASSTSSPFTDGYQIFPRIASDVITSSSPVPNYGGVPTYPIDVVTTVTAAGVVDSLGTVCRVVGYVSTPNYRASGSGVEFTLTTPNNSAGLVVRNTSFNSYVPTMGDEVRVMGTIGQFRGLVQLNLDSIVVMSTNNTLPTPSIETNLGEATEGRIVRLNNMRLVNNANWGSGNNDIYFPNGGDTVVMRFDTDFGTNWGTAPTGAFDVIGVGGQFSSPNSAPFDNGYQIFPRIASDIIPVVATTPTINFPLAAQSQLESGGAFQIALPIAPVSPNPETIKVYVSNGAGVTSGDYTAFPNPVMDTITLSVMANASSVFFDVAITDDMMQEADEDITFTLVSPSAGLTIGAINTHVFTIQDNDTPIPTYDIADIDGTNAQGVMDSAGVYCKIIATVTSPQLSATRTDFFITNATNTAGIKVNQAGLISYNALMGDEIRVVGTLSQFRGGIQISADTLVVLSNGNPILPTIQSPSATIGEAEEGRVLRYNGVELVDTTGWPSANFGNFDMVLANGDTVILRLDSDIPTLWGPAPLGKFDVIGVAGQFASSTSAPFLDGYQLQPRVSTEIIVKLPKLAVTEVMPSSNLSGTIDGDWFELTNFGNDPIDLAGFSWDDESRLSGTHQIGTAAPFVIAPGQSIIFYEGLSADAVLWSQEWSQQGNGIVIVAEDDFGPIGFSGLSSNGDEVNFYDDKGQLISRATYTSANVTAGISIEFDTTSTLVGPSAVGVNGAYASIGGDIGSPGNMTPISIAEMLLNQMSIYPNPATDLVKIATATNASKTVVINDLTGRSVLQVKSTNETVELNVASLPAGVYLLEVSLDGTTATSKLVVQ